MRDEAQLQEEAVRDYAPRTVAWVTALGLLVAAGIFTLGFLIGGRMAKLDIAHEPVIDPIARLDVQRKLHDDLTFYDDLTAKQKVLPAPESPAKPIAAPAAAARSAPGAATATAQGTPVTVAKTPAGANVSPKNSPTVKASSVGAGKPVAIAPKPAPTAKLTSRNSALYQGLLGLHEGPARTGEFTVQVSSYQSSEEARAFCGVLERKGFKPFVVKTDLGLKGTWYRVRVGRFLEEAQAKQAKQTLARADIPSWVLRTE